MFTKLIYLYAKLVLKLQVPSIRDSMIHKKAKVCSKSNIIRTELGQYTYVGINTTIADTKIGKFCSIADFCTIGGGSHPADWVSTSPVFYSSRNVFKGNFSNNRFEEFSPVHIGNDVWIGQKSFIKAGIHIGNGAIIGAHSMVTHDVDDYAIIAGNPAKVIRYRFDPWIVAKLMEIKWWDFDDNELLKYSDLFNDPVQFIGKYSMDHSFSVEKEG